MTDQQMPPQAPPPDGPPQGPPMLPGADLTAVLASLLSVVNDCAVKAKGSGDVREVKEFAGAALNFSQSYAILHPALVAPQGVAPEVLARSQPPRPEPQPKAKTGGGA